MLGVLDGAILVVSAVEGVQPQTRILMRALQRLRIPTLIFVNKIDRPGADPVRVVEAVSERLTTCGRADGNCVRSWDARRSLRACRRRRPKLSGPTGGGRCGERRPDDGVVRRQRVFAPRSGSAQAARGADEAGDRVPDLLRFRDDGRRRGAADGSASQSCCRRRKAILTVRFPLPSSRSSAVRTAKRSRSRGCSPERSARATGCASASTPKR